MFLLAIGGGVAARASFGASEGTAKQAGSPFSNLRVCGTNRIPNKSKQCTRDMRKSALVFKEVDCSVVVNVSKSSTFSASISYNGRLQYLVHTLLKRGKHKELVGARVTSSPMPAGAYTCDFRLGSEHVKAQFTSKGPTGHFVGATVCVTPSKRNRYCSADASGKPIAAPRSLMCGGIFVGFAGKSWGVRIVRQTSANPVTVAQYGARHLRAPIAEQWVGFKSRTKAGVYRPAKYTCLYYAAGHLVASHDFTVTK